MTSDALGSGVVSQSINGLDSREFRASYMAPGLRAYLADQIRALRGNRSQREFGRLIGKPQSVVSRLENEDYGKLSCKPYWISRWSYGSPNFRRFCGRLRRHPRT